MKHRLTIAVLALSCALLGSGAAHARTPAPRAASAHSHARARHGCARGHVLLGLAGPLEVTAGQPQSYLVIARACSRGHVLRHVRFSLLGPQHLAWALRRVRATASARKRITLTFPAPAHPWTLALSARSARGKLLGRLRVSIRVLASPPPLRAGGNPVGWGVNLRGEVGAGFRSPPVTRAFGSALRHVVEVAAGYNSGYALLNDGTVRAWGGNGNGQLGDGTNVEKPAPVAVLGLTHVKQIAASGAHAMALLENGTVFTWGADFWGNLGNGTRDVVEGTPPHPIPQQVPGLSGVASIAAGGADDLAILANGTVVGWGEDKNGQLGDNSKEMKLVPTHIAGLANVRTVAMGGVASLGGHLLALLNDGRVMVAGQNEYGQLGLGDTADRRTVVALPGLEHVTSISASWTHSLAVLAGGAVVSWGRDDDGELGYPGPQVCSAKPCGTVPRAVAITPASAVSAGMKFSVALVGGRAFAWGNNELGQLGDGTTTPSTAPVPVAELAGLTTIDATERFTLALAETPGRAADFTLRSAPGVLIAEWAPLPGPEQWTVQWRPLAKPLAAWGKNVVLPASAHSFVIGGLSKGTTYEVRLSRLNSSFTERICEGAPG